MNNKGWIRVIEAFFSVLMIVGAGIFVVQGGIQEDNTLEKIYIIEGSILREIALNESLRTEITGTSGTIEWSDFPSLTKNKIINKVPEGLECVAKICPTGSTCLLEEESEKDVYAHSAFIFSTLTNYNPRIVKLFCNY